MVMSVIPLKTRDEAETDIINSIALMEEAISNILNMESKKLQLKAGTSIDYKIITNTIDEVLQINESVTDTISSLNILQMLLNEKLDSVIDDTEKLF